MENKLCYLVDIIENNEKCVLLKVKDNKKLDLIKLGCFDGNEDLLRLTKGKKHTCTIFRKDNTSFSWDWGEGGFTLVSDNTRKKGHLIEECIKEDFDIYIGSKDDKIKESLFITSMNDTLNRKHQIKFMYWNKKDNNICTHKDGEFYKYFRTISDGLEHFESLGYNFEYQDTYQAKTGCYVEMYQMEREKVLDNGMEI